jgi:hypothetical protein
MKIILNATVDSSNFNVLLENYGLNNFQHRLFIRMAFFIHNIVNCCIDQAPKLLKDQSSSRSTFNNTFKKLHLLFTFV